MPSPPSPSPARLELEWLGAALAVTQGCRTLYRQFQDPLLVQENTIKFCGHQGQDFLLSMRAMNDNSYLEPVA